MEFGREHFIASVLAGTVPLPSPFPAFGRVAVLYVPKNDKKFESYFKIIHVQAPKHIITRLVLIRDVRGVRRPGKGESTLHPETWPFLTAEELAAELPAAPAKDGDKIKGEVEIALYPAAIVYVPESAAVLHRIEFGVTAAVSAESMGFYDHSHQGGCCRPPDDGHSAL